MATAQQAATAQQTAAAAALAAFFELARENPVSQTGGSFPTGSAGGPAVVASFSNTIPTESVWARRIELYVNLTVSLTVPVSGSVTVSPLAPYSSILSTFGINNQNYWNVIPGSAFYLDDLTQTRDGGEDVDFPYGPTANLYDNPWFESYLFAYTSGYAPGTTITNAGTASETLTLNYIFCVPIQLQRLVRRPFGMVPLGDPDNRPNHLIALNTLVGTDPAKNLFVNASATATPTAATSGTPTVAHVLPSLDITLLPPNASASPVPTVGLALQVNEKDTVGMALAQKTPLTHRTAFIYERILAICQAGGLPVNPDYVDLENTDAESDSTWGSAYTTDNANLQALARVFQRRYHRLPPKGCVPVDLSSGDFPDLPNVSPQVWLMTPSLNLAAALPGLIATPALQTRWRIPTGSGASPIVEAYEFGVAPVSY